jgi:hypothetical protein
MGTEVAAKKERSNLKAVDFAKDTVRLLRCLLLRQLTVLRPSGLAERGRAVLPARILAVHRLSLRPPSFAGKAFLCFPIPAALSLHSGQIE